MNIDTGHLVDTSGMTPEELLGLRQVGYEEVPPGLSRAARRALAGKKETKISLTSGGQLSRWAAAKRKARRKMAKESRRKNRGK